MKHDVPGLIEIAYQYFPRGMWGNEPDFDQTVEVRRRQAAHARASALYEAWRAMLRRLRARFPEERFPGVSVENLSYALQSSGAEATDLCFSGYLWLPVRGAHEKHHKLVFLVSFVVPYYVLHSSTFVFLSEPSGPFSSEEQKRFALEEDESTFGRAIDEEIRATFPDHERMPQAVCEVVVPEVRAGGHGHGEATLLDCLFSGTW